MLDAGLAGLLGLRLFMARVKLRALLIDLTAEDVGGATASTTLRAQQGPDAYGPAGMAMVMSYVQKRQAVIRHHENPGYLRGLGITVEIGRPRFVGEHAVEINGRTYAGRLLGMGGAAAYCR